MFYLHFDKQKRRIQWFEATIPSERHKSIENDESRWLIWHTNSNVFLCFFVLNIIVVIHRMYTLKWLDTNKRTQRARKTTTIDNDGTQSDIIQDELNCTVRDCYCCFHCKRDVVLLCVCFWCMSLRFISMKI